jgi:predicted nuclease with TOPRIM domain
MSRPPKPYLVLQNEKKSNRTKAELKQRKEAEEALLTGVALKERQEVKDNPVAHKEFLRINNLLKKIKKNDDIYGPIINRYCILLAECVDFEEKREKTYSQILKLEEKFEKIEDNLEYQEIKDFTKTISDLYKTLMSFDKQIQTKRRMLFDIEKENIMTISAALRSIPKEVKKEDNPLLKVLNGQAK